MLVYNVRAQPRLRALQRTPHACAAAATVDAIADFANWDPREQHRAQEMLIQRLGGLRSKGTSFPAVVRNVDALFGRLVEITATTADDLQEAVTWAANGYGVVIALAPPSGRGEGHAVRVLAGDIPELGRFKDLPPAIRNVVLPTRTMDLLGVVQVFDPSYSPNRFPNEVRYGTLRNRFELAGKRALIISRRHRP